MTNSRRTIPRTVARLRSIGVLILATACMAPAMQVSDYAVQVSASVQANPATITLQWPAPQSQPSGYRIFRKAKDASSWGSAIASLSGGATSFADANVSRGIGYDYKIEVSDNQMRFGHIHAGWELPLVESRGILVLVVDSSVAPSLVGELERLKQDLVGDGWKVIRRDVSRTASVGSVRSVIGDVYRGNANVKAALLFGHVPVPYSGDIVPDGHPEHQGAWPTDAYYADVDGTWTDSSVNRPTGPSPRSPWNNNVPGDGKFDQSAIPSDAELEVGRVDLHDMTGFGKSEIELLRQYLNKDHNYRQGRLQMPRRALMRDDFGDLAGAGIASVGWRNFAPLFGAGGTTSVGVDQWFPTLAGNAYLFGYSCGAGWYAGCSGTGNTEAYAASDPKVVFTMHFGSWFGDWDNNKNFLKAPLCTPTYGLTCVWAAWPNYFFQHMALGETIGYGVKLTRNNNGMYWTRTGGGNPWRGIQAGMMGDPSLRLHALRPATNAQASASNGTITVGWSRSDDSVLGYHVYRASSLDATFSRITSGLVTGTSVNDAPPAGSWIYMVRAVRLEQSPSGSYHNASQGAFTGQVSTSGGASAITPVISSAATASGTVGTPFTYAIIASGSPTGFGKGTRSMPPGLSLNTTSGVISGVPTTAGTWVFTVEASNTAGTGAKEVTFTIGAGSGDGGSGGLNATYYDNRDLSGATVSRLDPIVDFNWGGGSPASGIGADTFSARWTGHVQMPQASGWYTFHVVGDDGVRLWVNDRQLVDRWIDQGATEATGWLYLEAGRKYTVRLEYYENGGAAQVQLLWSGPAGMTRRVVPSSQLSH